MCRLALQTYIRYFSGALLLRRRRLLWRLLFWRRRLW
jgi:hypothetical protein